MLLQPSMNTSSLYTIPSSFIQMNLDIFNGDFSGSNISDSMASSKSDMIGSTSNFPSLSISDFT